MRGATPAEAVPAVEGSTGTSRQQRKRCPSSATVRSTSSSSSRAAAVVVGEKEDADAVAAGLGEPVDLGGEEQMRDLQENSGPVAGLGVGARGAAVLEVRERAERPPDGLVRGRAVETRDEGDAAGVVLVGRVVEAGCCRPASRSGSRRDSSRRGRAERLRLGC